MPVPPPVADLIELAWRQNKLPGPKTREWLRSLDPDQARVELAKHVFSETDERAARQLGIDPGAFMVAKLTLDLQSSSSGSSGA